MKKMFEVGGSLCVALLTSCTADKPVTVSSNELGITSLDVDRSEIATNGDRVLEVRGLDADGVAVATMRYRIGYVDSLTARGTEIEWITAGKNDRMTTRTIAPRETRVQGPQRMFGALPEMRALADRELGLRLDVAGVQGEVPYVNSWIDTCASENLRDDGPFGKGCCREVWDGNAAWVTFRNEGNGTVSNRFFGGGQNNWHTCGMYDGSVACAGPNNSLDLPVCDFGPCGAANPQIYTASAVHRYQWLDNGPYCGWDDSPPDWNPDGVSGSCPYRTCDYGTPVTGGDGHGYWDAD